MQARDARLEMELKAIADREQRAAMAEARAAESASQLSALNERLLNERRAHATTLTELQDRLSDANPTAPRLGRQVLTPAPSSPHRTV